MFVGFLCFVLDLLFITLRPSSFVIILMGKRELVALLYLSSCCHVTVSVAWLFLMVDLQCDIVVFPDHTHLTCLITKFMIPLALFKKSIC